KVMSALPPKADMCGANRDVRFGPKADSCTAPKNYSITSSARPSTAGGITRPSALAVLRLITSSYLVGAPRGGLSKLVTGCYIGSISPGRQVLSNHGSSGL